MGSLVALLIVSLLGAWHVSGFLKDIELRHPHVYEKLGRPSPQTTPESDVHTFAILRFLFLNQYQALNDPKLLAPARSIKVAMVFSTVITVVCLVALMLSPSVEAVLTLACLREH